MEIKSSIADEDLRARNGKVAKASGVENLKMGVDLVHDALKVRANGIEGEGKAGFGVADDTISPAQGGDSRGAFGAIKINAKVETNAADIADSARQRFQGTFIDSKEAIDKGVEFDKVGEVTIDGCGEVNVRMSRLDSPKNGSNKD